MPCGTVSFERLALATPWPRWETSTRPIDDVVLHVSSPGTIEDDGRAMLQVDFANKLLGGGVLSRGCVQEEIRMLICPELLLSRLLTEELAADEALVMTGCERYSDYSGYADTFRWRGDFREDEHGSRDAWGRRQVEVVAIDATAFRSVGGAPAQFQVDMVRRELNKALTGFRADSFHVAEGGARLSAVATGNWGCGAFRGHPQLKALIQLMACAEAARDICYFTFGDEKFGRALGDMYSFLCSMRLTVCDVWHLIRDFCEAQLTASKELSSSSASTGQFDLFK